jgi:carboxyl-terminal processing protease
LIALALLCPLLLVAGIYLGGHPQLLPGPARDALVADSDAQLYEEALDMIERTTTGPWTGASCSNRSLGSAVEGLRDDFSNYFTPSDYVDFRQSTNGEFVGIGISVESAETLKRGLRVLKVYDGLPAERAGLKVGDLVIEVNGRRPRDKARKPSPRRSRGPSARRVTLTFGSGDRRVTEKVKRARVSLPSCRAGWSVTGPQGAYVSLASFTSGAHGKLARPCAA